MRNFPWDEIYFTGYKAVKNYVIMEYTILKRHCQCIDTPIQCGVFSIARKTTLIYQ